MGQGRSAAAHRRLPNRDPTLLEQQGKCRGRCLLRRFTVAPGQSVPAVAGIVDDDIAILAHGSSSRIFPAGPLRKGDRPAVDWLQALYNATANNKGSRPNEETNMTLYERLGGVFAIAAVVDEFINRIMDDPRLNANPKVDEAHHRVSRAGFKYLVTEQVCQATGGPQRYTGRSMHDSHAHLDITEPEWQVFLYQFKQVLDKFQVPAAEQAELFAIVDSTKGDIVLKK